MTEIEFYLLSCVVDNAQAIAFLNRTQDFLEETGIGIPDFPDAAIAETLGNLFQRGDISVTPRSEDPEKDDETPVEDLPFATLNHDEIIAELGRTKLLGRTKILGLVSEQNLYYYLTPQGGKRWEASVKPQWDLLYRCASGYINYEEGLLDLQLSSGNRDLMESTKRRFMRSFGAVLLSEEWENLEPWRVNYWKTLPHGYWMKCQLQKRSELQPGHYSSEDILHATDEPWYHNPWLSQ